MLFTQSGHFQRVQPRDVNGNRCARSADYRGRAKDRPLNQFVKVPFHQDTLCAMQDGAVTRVAVKEISDGLGLDWTAQLRRLKRDPILSEGMSIMDIPSLRGGMQQTVTLPLPLLNDWLLRIVARHLVVFRTGAASAYPRARALAHHVQQRFRQARHMLFDAPAEGSPHTAAPSPGGLPGRI
jgi:hypothetical protein